MNVLLFGIIAEKAGTDHMQLQARSLNELRQVLRQHIPGLDGLAYAIAVDRVIVHIDMPLSGGEEIAVLPPFAGG
jgi:molybdopterin converting factor small subunit